MCVCLRVVCFLCLFMYACVHVLLSVHFSIRLLSDFNFSAQIIQVLKFIILILVADLSCFKSFHYGPVSMFPYCGTYHIYFLFSIIFFLLFLLLSDLQLYYFCHKIVSIFSVFTLLKDFFLIISLIVQFSYLN